MTTTPLTTVLAGKVQPGMTIKTYPGQADSAEPITLTVADGGWVDVDVFGNWIEPKGEESTHVYLSEADPEGTTLLLPVDAPVVLVRS